jgi:hypothetical protein
MVRTWATARSTAEESGGEHPLRDPPERHARDGACSARPRGLVTLSDSDELPLRFIAGADVMSSVEQNLAAIQEQIDANRELSASLSYDS